MLAKKRARGPASARAPISWTARPCRQRGVDVAVEHCDHHLTRRQFDERRGVLDARQTSVDDGQSARGIADPQRHELAQVRGRQSDLALGTRVVDRCDQRVVGGLQVTATGVEVGEQQPRLDRRSVDRRDHLPSVGHAPATRHLTRRRKNLIVVDRTAGEKRPSHELVRIHTRLGSLDGLDGQGTQLTFAAHRGGANHSNRQRHASSATIEPPEVGEFGEATNIERIDGHRLGEGQEVERLLGS